jgi:DNA adenine methylase
MKSPLRWVGGKNAEADYLASLLPPHSCYVEVFGGGASVLLAKRPSEVEVYNDLNGELVNFFRVVKERPAEFKASWKWCLVSKEEFYALAKADTATMDPIQRAYRFVYINRSSFGADMRSPVFGRSARDESLLLAWLDNLEANVEALHRRLRRTYIENEPFAELIPRWDKGTSGPQGTAFFLDPPYLGTSGYEVGTLTVDDHALLAERLGTLKNRFLLTINNHPAIRAFYDGCHIMERTKQYSISKSAEARKEYAELVITNYQLPDHKQATFF